METEYHHIAFFHDSHVPLICLFVDQKCHPQVGHPFRLNVDLDNKAFEKLVHDLHIQNSIQDNRHENDPRKIPKRETALLISPDT